MDGQDWSQQGWNKQVTGKEAKSKDALNRAMRSGAGVETEAKFSSGNRQHGAVPNAVKLDADTDTFRHETVCKDFRTAMQQARLAKKMTQAQLANMIAEKPSVVNEYESGKAIPNGTIIQKLNKALGVQLPRSKAPKAKAKGKAKP